MSLNVQEMLASAILEEALRSPLGIVVKTNDVYRARASFYSTRTKLQDPNYADIQIRVSPDNPEGEIWLLRKSSVSAIALENLGA